MSSIILLFLVIILGVACVVMSVFLIEGRELYGHKLIRAWRIAWSKRRESSNAIASAKQSRIEAENARQDADTARKVVADRIARMGSYIIAEQSGEHIKGIKANNYHAKEKKVLRSIEVAAKNGYHLPADEQAQLVRMLQQAHEKALRHEEEKQKQAAIREVMREEEKARRERERAVKKAEEEQKRKEREAEIKQKALEEAISLLGDTHSEQIEEMKRKVAEARQEAEEARLAAERTKSMAEQTKQGHIYIISNIGSFGKDMFKVGMTRRLEPLDRVKELGDASVPFSFDVHAMISADDAPALEAALHRRLSDYRVNKVNFRKEFFRVSLDQIITAVEAEHGTIEYQADPEALEYFESVSIAEEQGTTESRILAEASITEEG
ncbi:MAG: GIY-YIG nuclease family protein [Planctomycetota bacterium]